MKGHLGHRRTDQHAERSGRLPEGKRPLDRKAHSRKASEGSSSQVNQDQGTEVGWGWGWRGAVSEGEMGGPLGSGPPQAGETSLCEVVN